VRIGIFTPYLDSLSGGEKYMLTLAHCLSRSHNVTLFWDPQDEAFIKKETLRKFNLNIENLSFTKSIFTPKTSLLKRLQETKKYDYIIYLSDGSIPVVSCKLIIHFQFPVEWVKNSFLAKQKIKRVKKIICNSYFTKQFIDKKFSINSDVIYPPVTLYNSSIEKQNTILTVGRFGKNKSGSIFKKQDFLIDSFKKLVDKDLKKWNLLIIISYNDKDKSDVEELKKLAKDYPITFLENVSNAQIEQAYKKAKIYWHASGFGEDLKKYPERAEHFGISTVEAMSAGCVPVVINAGGQTEIIESRKNGLVWSSQDELIDFTQEVINNQNLWKNLAKEAIKRAEDFSPDRFCKNIQNLIS
jgi:glycosyltransferase involved in cell wall biosynthesis